MYVTSCVYMFCWCILCILFSFSIFYILFIMRGNNHIVLLSEIQVNGGLFFVK